jgi:hypothetical protein
LDAADKKRIASMGAKARMESLTAARRIAANFRYAVAIDDLRGGPKAIRRVSTCGGPLPGIYPSGA